MRRSIVGPLLGPTTNADSVIGHAVGLDDCTGLPDLSGLLHRADAAPLDTIHKVRVQQLLQ